jgi:hypothetical protein
VKKALGLDEEEDGSSDIDSKKNSILSFKAWVAL